MESFNTLSIFTTASASASASASSSSSSSSSNNHTRMDSRIWSKLPQVLIDRILVFLPPPAFFRSRCVCKRWYGLIFSDSFLEMHLRLSPSRLRHWFIFFKFKNSKTSFYGDGSRQGFLFDPHDNAWYRVEFGSIPSGFSPASSSGGLLCWVSDEPGPKSVILFNPLSKFLSQLPPTLRPRLYPSVGLSVSNSSFSVVIAGDDLISPFAVKNLTAEAFLADGGGGFYSMWGTSCSLPRLCSLESGRMVFINHMFFCMNFSPFSVLAYDLSSNDWCKIQAPMRRFLRSPSLVECRGRVVLVAAVEKSKLNVPRSVRLWGLQECGRTWVEVERMPQELYGEFAEAEGGRGFECIGHGDFIVVTIKALDEALLFDFYRKIWRWIPRCPFIDSGGGGGGGLHGFAYEPRLATPALGLLDPLSLPFQSFNG